jgi:uncharacterized protein (DUF2235 family)
MALYAFDGTWNTDQPDAEKMTNVIKFRDAYAEKAFYREGVGTRFGPFGKLIGGMSGAGGRERIEEGLEALIENFQNGDTTIDIVGFSRGAALAVHFANQIAKGVKGLPAGQAVRFLGIWDIVASFDIPGNTIDLGWDLGMPSNVQFCFHAMALDEKRVLFPLNRLSGHNVSSVNGPVAEVWFRGVHSDVGGGDPDLGLSSIALNWMLRNAIRCGLVIVPEKVVANQAIMSPGSDISHHSFELAHLFKDIHRTVRPTDVVHFSVQNHEGSQFNNPPATLSRMDDDGAMTTVAVAAGASGD